MYEDAVKAASAVVNDPAVIDSIRRAAGIPDPDVITIDLDHLTIEEIEKMEELSGAPFDSLWQDGKPKGRIMRVFATIVRQRDDPSFTMEQAGKLKIKFDKGGAVPPPASGG